MKNIKTVISVIFALVILSLFFAIKGNAQKAVPAYLKQTIAQIEVNRSEEKVDAETVKSLQDQRQARACRTISLLMVACESEYQDYCDQKNKALHWFRSEFGSEQDICQFGQDF